MDIYVVYHDPCLDGFTAQFVMSKLLHSADTPVHAIPLSHNKRDVTIEHLADIVTPNSIIVYIDISPTSDDVALLSPLVNTIYVFDHHIDLIERGVMSNIPIKDAHLNWFDIDVKQSVILPNVRLCFSNDVSGSKLAALAAAVILGDYPSHQNSIDAAAEMYQHPMLALVSDFDTGQRVLPDTHAFDAYLRDRPRTQREWSNIFNAMSDVNSDEYQNMITRGVAAQERRFERASAKIKEKGKPHSIVINGTKYKGMVVRTRTSFTNDIAHLVLNEPGACCQYVIVRDRTHDGVKVSVRSQVGVPANTIARMITNGNGGGHSEAAGGFLALALT